MFEYEKMARLQVLLSKLHMKDFIKTLQENRSEAISSKFSWATHTKN